MRAPTAGPLRLGALLLAALVGGSPGRLRSCHGTAARPGHRGRTGHGHHPCAQLRGTPDPDAAGGRPGDVQPGARQPGRCAGGRLRRAGACRASAGALPAVAVAAGCRRPRGRQFVADESGPVHRSADRLSGRRAGRRGAAYRRAASGPRPCRRPGRAAAAAAVARGDQRHSRVRCLPASHRRGATVGLAAVNPEYFINHFTQLLEPRNGRVQMLRHDGMLLLSSGPQDRPGAQGTGRRGDPRAVAARVRPVRADPARRRAGCSPRTGLRAAFRS
ncbi:MAG: hypothetical protein MZW92_29745 [Comamonadaceae bacterium]|nr:hypothetical protein [Comamonadaceae bacterium]